MMIVAKNLCKSFSNNIDAVNDVSFHIAKGEFVGLIGANGAGKTTLIKLICGLLAPSKGFVRIFYSNPLDRKHEIGTNMGIIFGSGGPNAFGSLTHCYGNLQSDLTIKSNFEIIKNIYKISNEKYNAKIKELCSILDIKSFLNYRVDQLSLGQCMRAEVAAVLLYDPELLILDEPFIGVDIVAKEAIREILKSLSNNNKTIILTTHSVEEVEHICSRVLLLDKGRLVCNGSFDRIKSAHASINRLSVTVNGIIPDFQDLPIIKYTIDKNRVSIWYESNVLQSKDITNYLLSKCKLTDLLISKPTIEDVIKKIYEEGNNEQHNN